MFALTEKRGKELDKWWAINFLRYMQFQDPISPTLSDMPTEILVQVLEKLDSIEQLICRKVCRSLRTAVEKFEIYFDSICFHVWNNRVDLYLDELKILYKNAANGASLVTYNNKKRKMRGRKGKVPKTTMVKGENFMQVAFNDLRILLKRVRKFEFNIYGGETHAKVTYLLNVLKANQCVHVKEIELSFLSLIDICSILPYFNSQMLESIDLDCDDANEHSEQLARLEQWKNSKDCTIYGSLGDNIPIQHLLHFKKIHLDMKEYALQKMVEIKDKLLIRSTFEECTVWFENTSSIEVAKVFQPHYSGSEAFEIEYICNNDKFEISCDEEVSGSRRMYIERC